MDNEKRSPATRGGVNRANAKIVQADFDVAEGTGDSLAFQAAFIAHRYRLPPRMARLVCHLAAIGGRMA